MTLLTAAIYLLALVPSTVALFQHIDLPVILLLFVTFLAWTIYEHRLGVIHLPPSMIGKTQRVYREQNPGSYFAWLALYLLFGGGMVGVTLMMLREQYR